jgi:hypothetical protein
MSLTRPQFSRFSPHLLPTELLERRLVERGSLVDGVVEGLVGTLAEGGARHVVLVGARGSGKSHLFAVLLARIRAAALPQAPVVAALDEEEHVGSLLDLLARLLSRLPEVEGLPTAASQVALLRGSDRAEAVERALRLIEGRLQARPFLIGLENLDRILSAMSTEEQWRLRGIVTEQRWSVLATAQATGDDFHNRDRPFYRMWIEEPVGPLSPEGCRDMLLTLAEDRPDPGLAERLQSPLGLARVRAIHHLIGGSPRGMALLFPYLTRESLDELETAFYQLGDELTPYFQEQIRARAPGQQALLERLSESWRPLTVSELVDATFSTQGTVSGQLRFLRRDGLVQSHSVGRESFYELRDPLWRIARAMKRPDQAPKVFIRFLRFWHTRSELLARQGTPEGHQSWFHEALMWEGDEILVDSHLFKAIANEMEDSPTRAAELANELYLRQPCVTTAACQVFALILFGEWVRANSSYDELIQRFDIGMVLANFLGSIFWTTSPQQQSIASNLIKTLPGVGTDVIRKLLVLSLLFKIFEITFLSRENCAAAAAAYRTLISHSSSLANTVDAYLKPGTGWRLIIDGHDLWSTEVLATLPAAERSLWHEAALTRGRPDLAALVAPTLPA